MSENFGPAALALLISLTGFAILAQRFIPRMGQTFVEPEQLKWRLDEGEDIVVLDVRTRQEFESKMGRVPGSVNLPMSDFKARLKDIEEQLSPHKDKPVCVVCRFENRSPPIARLLKKAGFTQVAILKGGIMRWYKKKLPVEKGALPL